MPESYFGHRRFPVNFAKLLRTPFLQNTSGRLLVKVIKMMSGFLTHSSLASDELFFLEKELNLKHWITTKQYKQNFEPKSAGQT